MIRYTALTIALMATVTYTTRIGGYILLRNRTISDRMKAVMECAPGCVLITVIRTGFRYGTSSRPHRTCDYFTSGNPTACPADGNHLHCCGRLASAETGVTDNAQARLRAAN